jgi:hypothetical protein
MVGFSALSERLGEEAAFGLVQRLSQIVERAGSGRRRPNSEYRRRQRRQRHGRFRRRANALIERFRRCFPDIYYAIYWETRLMNAQAYIGANGRSVRLYGGLEHRRQVTRPATISADRCITSSTPPSAAMSAPTNGPRRLACRRCSARQWRAAMSATVSRSWRRLENAGSPAAGIGH